jgi:hypothetical protein
MEVSMNNVHETCFEAPATQVTRSVFPADAHALIFRPAHSVTMSAPRRKNQWKLQFERRSPLRLEPLMGWTEDDDPLTQVELSFDSAEAAVAYARRQGLQYTVMGPEPDPKVPPVTHGEAPSTQRSLRPQDGELQCFAKTPAGPQLSNCLPALPPNRRNALSNPTSGYSGRIAA